MITTLDLFVLMLIRDGVSTPYDMQVRANISTGATLPSIRRLLSNGLIKEAKKGPRGRREFSLTPSGRREVQSVARSLDTEAPGDLESVLRLACMAVVDGKPASARELLLQAAAQYAQRSRRAKKSTLALQSERPTLAGLYAAALAHCDEKRHDATRKSLESLIIVWGAGPQTAFPPRSGSRPRR